MKIYAITKGSYSDYHICALTVNEDKAYRLQKIYSDDYERASITEFEDGEGEALRLMWFCNEYGHDPKLYEFQEKERVATDRYGNIYGVYLYARDEKHAEKKAHDMIAEYRARQAGIS